MYLIGTDEAGYGPNLGPLLVSASVWHVPDELAKSDLYELLAEAVSCKAVAPEDDRLPIADSKQLYSSGDSWQQLELGLLAALGCCGHTVDSWRGVWSALAADRWEQLSREPWHDRFDMPAPRDAQRDDIRRRQGHLANVMAAADVRLVGIFARPVCAAEFNALVDELGNKSSALSHVTLTLARNVLAGLADNERALIHCDKHGGRNNYRALIQHFFPDELLRVQVEGRAASIYHCHSPARSLEFRFVAKGESFLPAALASMACKYLRELSMHAFNQFWQTHIPGLKATAGYPVDALRFKSDIALVQSQLQITDDMLWRRR